MGNVGSKKGSGLSRTNSLGSNTLARFPSLGGPGAGGQTLSNIPEEVIAAHDNVPSEPILIRPIGYPPDDAAANTALPAGHDVPNTSTGTIRDSKSASAFMAATNVATAVANINSESTTRTNPLSSPRMRASTSLAKDADLDLSLNRTSTFDVMTGMNSGLSMGADRINIDDMIHRLLEAGYSGKISKSVPLKNAEIIALCQVARELFLSQPSLIELSAPVKIVGDIHGQFHDLLRLFEMCGYPPSANFLFLGDYVDRGKQSLETILLLFCYKIKHPENFFLLRGNHECANVTRVYGFYDECKRRCNVKVWKMFVSVFNCLPIAAVVAGKIFCVHGGLSPHMRTLDDVRALERPCEVPDYGLLNDLLWSDPSEAAFEWEDNERGVSYCFGKRVVGDFLQQHDLDLVCRAHMVVEDGYEFFGDRQLVTIFSAPNYCGEFDNYGAVMGVSDELMCSFELLKPMDEPMRHRRTITQAVNGIGACTSDAEMDDDDDTAAAAAAATAGAGTPGARRPSPPMRNECQSV